MKDRLQKEKDYTLAKYKLIESSLNQIYELIKTNISNKDLIKLKYKELKVWFKTEYNKVSKNKLLDGYIIQWYEPLISDIYVISFGTAKTNSSIENIQMAIIDSLNYFNYWNDQLKEYKAN